MSTTFNKQVLSSREAAEFLDISQSQLYALTHSRQIPYYKPSGKLIYFKLSELEDYAFQNRQSTETELQNEAARIINRNTKSYGKTH